MQAYDAIVLGLGAMGSAAIYHLSRRGHSVLGLDTHHRGHSHGSSHGSSRIIRQAYHESPDYVPLINRAYTLWRALEEESGQRLIHLNGGLIIGRPGSRTVHGTITSAQLHSLPYEELTPSDVHVRFPGFRLTDDLVAVFEPNAGFLQAERCVDAFLDCAKSHGAECRYGESVICWKYDGSGILVESNRAIYRTGRIVIAAGPWSGEVLADLKLPLVIHRIVNSCFSPIQPDLYDIQTCPIFSLLVPEGHYYGVPGETQIGLKIGRGDSHQKCTPESINRCVAEDEVEMFRRVLDRYIPESAGVVKSSTTCMYTLTPDKHFIIDRHPTQDQVVIACGFSGHGFKFASVIGEILADLAISGTTSHDIEFLSLDRFRA